MSVFINLSNHNSADWSTEQITAANAYGELLDLVFPDVDPYWTDEKLNQVVDSYFAQIMAYPDPVVMLQGEFVFTYRLTNRLIRAGIPVFAACSKRKAIEYTDENDRHIRRSEFEFVQFRRYEDV